MSIRILIADDHGLVRAGMRALLSAEPDLEVVGEAADGFEALRLAGELNPDIVLLDISMPGLSGVEATRRIVKMYPNIRVLIFTVHEDSELLREAIQAGVMGYILKRAIESELITAIQAVMRGDLYVHPALTRALLSNQHKPQNHHAAVEALSAREVRFSGLSSRDIPTARLGKF